MVLIYNEFVCVRAIRAISTRHSTKLVPIEEPMVLSLSRKKIDSDKSSYSGSCGTKELIYGD